MMQGIWRGIGALTDETPAPAVVVLMDCLAPEAAAMELEIKE